MKDMKDSTFKTHYEQYFVEKSNFTGKDQRFGRLGFANLGNTCYMNAALRCLVSCDELKEFIIDGKHKPLLLRADHEWTKKNGMTFHSKGNVTTAFA